MEHSNILLNFLVILAMVIIATNDADGYKILTYDEDAPTYPWGRIVYRRNQPEIPERQDDDLDTNTNGQIEIKDEKNRTEPTLDYKGNNKRIYGFHENMSELKKYGKAGASIIYGRVSLPVIVLSSYPEPNQ